jgi:hypothetical protein
MDREKTMSDLFKRAVLDNGLTVEFSDETIRYYGDYHRVQIDVFIVFTDGRRELFQRPERMGVSSDQLDSVKTQVMSSFRQDTLRYMAAESFPEKFLKALKVRKVKPLAGLR